MKIKSVDVIKIGIATKKTQKTTDVVAEEKPLHIFLNKHRYATIFCSPNNLKELTVGHLLSESILETTEEIEELTLKDGICRVRLKPDVDLTKRLKLADHYSRVILSACGSQTFFQPSRKVAKIESDLKVKAGVIFDCVNRLNFIAETFRKTGGVHAAAIYNGNGELVAFAEDIGRHNAVDKVMGLGALDRIDFGRCFLASTGRLTGDIVLKAAKIGLPIVASLAAAIDSGIAIAKEVDLTLIGFARGKRMNIYSGVRRVVV